jgi:hypothetical protein
MKGKTLKALARAQKPHRGAVCAVCKHPLRSQIDDCIRDGLGNVGIIRALVQKLGECALTINNLKHHKEVGHVAAR